MPLFELSDIRFGYPGHADVLEGAGFILEDSDRLSITGHNGAGKSTLLKIMVGLLKPASGRVAAFGTARKEEADFLEVRRRAGLVFQDADDQLFCPTVMEDIAFGPLNLGKSRDEAVAIVDDVLTRLDLLPLRERVTHRLSGGEKRLVTLASVLAMEPDVLLLDEPTNGLDEANEERLTDILLSLPQAMVVISHDPHFRRKIATRRLHLADGRLADPDPSCRNADPQA